MAPPQAAEKEYTLDDIGEHTSPESCWLVIGNSTNGGPKVYDVTKYLDDHPGGSEVMLDVAGQNADDFFEDIGHSQEARQELKKYLIGTFKMDAASLAKMQAEQERKAQQGKSINSLVVISVVLLAIAYGYYQTQMK